MTSTVLLLRKTIFFAMLLLVTVIITGCGDSSSASDNETNDTINLAPPENLVIISNQMMEVPKAAMDKVVADFKLAYPDIIVDYTIVETEKFKDDIVNHLAAEEFGDIVTWYAGERLNEFIEKNQVYDISSFWTTNSLNEKMASTSSSITFNAKQYALPVSYYNYGIFYNKNLYNTHNIAIPETYDQLIDNCSKLNSVGIAPVAIGTKYLWTAAAWFDYINMRTHGYQFHIDLLQGKISYTDTRVKESFLNFKQAVDADCFEEGHENKSWTETGFPLGTSASYLMGSFLAPFLDSETYGIYEFPSINPSVDKGEDAPTDVLFIPENSKNKSAALLFLAFMADSARLSEYNNTLQTISPHADSSVPTNPFLVKGAEILSSAKTAQFLDRDTKSELANLVMSKLVAFMLDSDQNLDTLLEELENQRALSYDAE